MSHAYTEPSRSMLLFYRFVYDPLRSRQLRRLVASLGLDGSERVLVFGSGAGSEATYVAAALKRGGRVTCLDISTVWLAEAQRRLRRHPNVDFVLGEAPLVGLVPASFDLVLAHYAIHDVDRSALPATLTALAGALKTGGRFVVVEPAGGSHIQHAQSPDELRDYMAAAGMDEVSREEVASLPGGANRSVFTKRGERREPGQWPSAGLTAAWAYQSTN
jgi:SAM-dependent methyltransferase